MRRIRRASAAMVAAGALVACGAASTHPRAVPTTPQPSGEAGKPAATIVNDARTALLAASSVRVTGTITVNASASASSAQRFDLRLTRVKGMPEATGTVMTTTVSAKNRSTVTLAIIRIAGRLYIRGDRAYYARIGPKAAAVAGRWLAVPASQDTSVSSLTDLSAIAAGFSYTSQDRVTDTARLGSVLGVVVMANPSARLYVATSGPPRPLRLQRSLNTSGADATLDFGDYDAPLSVAAPAGAIDIAKVRG